ncbi:dephospho-CoA kinase [Flavobacteriaceae bacterium XHP0103]|uniref:dephospho-CoA kinase n=1 Tax=Marixanthotalea marina TaxID=2844359 RepID=UPI002989F571|nr:dephospho-CoA kinase [Marixanthotalea marina]MBU3822573.1 dephospho-CoA kinase [Marixanthotalea marina]
MIVVGLTGGIGSGKTTVAKMFGSLGVPVYIADEEAKKLMNTSKVIKRKLIGLFGENAYVNNELNRPFIADIIFKNKTLLNEMNAIVHPKVRAHFNKWVSKQTAPYVIKEAAILFENGSHKAYDFIITVTAPKDLKVTRLLKREPNTTKNKIEAIMANQWTDEAKIKRSHFVIENINLEKTQEQVKKIHTKIAKIAKKC